jgi:hypothetical protein
VRSAILHSIPEVPPEDQEPVKLLFTSQSERVPNLDIPEVDTFALPAALRVKSL